MKYRVRKNARWRGKMMVTPMNVTAFVSFMLIFCLGYFRENAWNTVLRGGKLILSRDGVHREEKVPLTKESVNAGHVQGKDADNRKSSNKSSPSNRKIPLDSLKPLEVHGKKWKIFNSSNPSPSPLGLGTASHGQSSSIKGQGYLPAKEKNSLNSLKHGVLYRGNATTTFKPHPMSRNWRNLPKKLYELAPFIFDTVPKQFVPEFKNPCWYAHNKQLRCLPYFYLLGFPKCGTTDFWYKIGNHPKIAKTRQKESNYWKDFTIGSPLSDFYRYLSNGKSIHHRLLSGDTDAIYGDGSPTTVYMHWRFTEEEQNVTKDMYTKVHIIKELTPKAKMIILIRGPVVRFYSAYLYTGGHSTHDFHKEALKTINDFQKCLQRESILNCLCKGGPQIRAERLMTSMYLPFIEAWVDGFGFNQIMFIRFEDWIVNCTSILPKVYNFLELDALNEEVIRDVCSTKPINVNKRHISLGEMLPTTKQMLEEFFAPYNEELAKYLNISVYHATPQ